MDGILHKARHAAGRDWHLDLAALGGMALGGLIDAARLGPLGIMEICGDPGAGLIARIDAHAFGYWTMLAALALAAFAGSRAGGDRRPGAAWRTALHALAMCAGMAAADLAAPALPGPPTPWLSFLMMTLGMAAGSLAARRLIGGSRRRDALNRGRRWE